MIQLTAHFTLAEFELGAPVPEDCIPIFVELCAKILEPIRTTFEKRLVITSGYRSPEQNAEAHGQVNSEHIASPLHCACDFYVLDVSARFIFDWLRNSPSLPYHQLILEHSPNGSSIIHCSINKMKPGVRSVLEGATSNASPYTICDYIAYNPSSDPTQGQKV